jgi:PASTA domain
VPSFTVTAAGQKVTLDASGAAQAPFTVTNTSAQTLRGRLLTRPTDPAKAEWLSIVGESTRDFAPNAAEQVVIQLNVPQTTPPGTYSFRLDAVSELAPDEDFTEGPSVAFDVAAPPPPPKKKFPWWIFIVIGAVVLLIIIGVVIWLLTKDNGNKKMVAVPPVTSLPQAQAQQVLTATGFKVGVQSAAVGITNLIGQVLSQNPAAGTQAPEGSTVTIRVGSFRVIGTVGTPTGPIATIRITPPGGGVATIRIETARIRTIQTP